MPSNFNPVPNKFLFIYITGIKLNNHLKYKR